MKLASKALTCFVPVHRRGRAILVFLTRELFLLKVATGACPWCAQFTPCAWQEGPCLPCALRWESRRCLCLVRERGEIPFPSLLKRKRFVDSTNGFLTQGRGAGDRYKSGGIIASRCCLPSSPGPCVFQHPASSSEQNQGVSPKKRDWPELFQTAQTAMTLNFSASSGGRSSPVWTWEQAGSRTAAGALPVLPAPELGLYGKCRVLRDWGCNPDWQRWLHGAWQAALPDPCRRRLPLLRPASPRLAPPWDAFAINAAFFGIRAFLQRASLLAIVLMIIYWFLRPNNVNVWLTQRTCCSCSETSPSVWR